MASIGILAPLPTTPLYDRLKAEGRLYPDDTECAFIPKQMTRDQLKTGHRRLIQRTFAPDAFFERVFRTFQQSESFVEARAARYKKRRGTPSLRARITTFRLVMRLTHAIIAKGYWSLLMASPRAYRNNQALGAAAMPFREFIGLCLNQWHIYCICRGPQDSVMLESRDNAPA